MSRSKVAPLPKRRAPRRVLYGLLLATSALPLAGCEPHVAHGDCGSWDTYTQRTEEVPLEDGEGPPLEPSCAPCPDNVKSTGQSRPLYCVSRDTLQAPRSYHLACTYEWCNP